MYVLEAQRVKKAYWKAMLCKEKASNNKRGAGAPLAIYRTNAKPI